MTTKKLTSQQARWAEALAEYYFIIIYRPGRQNQLVDVLTRQDQELEAQNRVKTKYYIKAFLS